LCLKRKPSRLAPGRPGTPAPSHPRATAPIEEAESRLWQPIHAETTGSVHDTYRLIDRPRSYPRFPPDTLLGQAVGPH